MGWRRNSHPRSPKGDNLDQTQLGTTGNPSVGEESEEGLRCGNVPSWFDHCWATKFNQSSLIARSIMPSRAVRSAAAAAALFLVTTLPGVGHSQQATVPAFEVHGGP